MHCKNLIFQVVLLLLSLITMAQNSFTDYYKPGDRLYVYSRDGLSLREQADPKASQFWWHPTPMS
ncbi:MAG TPA: hypothetical protein VKQ08_03005 [Cyclobacteriaceae bacterium]|nr:hypothetical protein [Cyclobacteriaceae bacterium]